MKRITSLDFLVEDFTCEDLVQGFYGLNELEFSTYCTLLKVYESGQEWFTVREIQDVIGKEKTMINRALKKLSELDLVKREKKTATSEANKSEHEEVPTPKRGYYYIYTPLSLDDLIEDLQKRLDQWHSRARDEMGKIKTTFKEKHNLELNVDKVTSSI